VREVLNLSPPEDLVQEIPFNFGFKERTELPRKCIASITACFIFETTSLEIADVII